MVGAGAKWKKGAYERLVAGGLLETLPARLAELSSRCPVPSLVDLQQAAGFSLIFLVQENRAL